MLFVVWLQEDFFRSKFGHSNINQARNINLKLVLLYHIQYGLNRAYAKPSEVLFLKCPMHKLIWTRQFDKWVGGLCGIWKAEILNLYLGTRNGKSCLSDNTKCDTWHLKKWIIQKLVLLPQNMIKMLRDFWHFIATHSTPNIH